MGHAHSPRCRVTTPCSGPPTGNTSHRHHHHRHRPLLNRPLVSSLPLRLGLFWAASCSSVALGQFGCIVAVNQLRPYQREQTMQRFRQAKEKKNNNNSREVLTTIIIVTSGWRRNLCNDSFMFMYIKKSQFTTWSPKLLQQQQTVPIRSHAGRHLLESSSALAVMEDEQEPGRQHGRRRHRMKRFQLLQWSFPPPH